MVRWMDTSTWFVSVAMGCIALIVGSGIYWILFDSSVPLRTTYARPLGADFLPKARFQAGELMYVARDFCGDRDTPVLMGRSINGKQEPHLSLSYPATAQMLRQGCRHGVTVIPLPEFLTPGPYVYRTIMQWSNNPWHSGVLELPLVEFEIVR